MDSSGGNLSLKYVFVNLRFDCCYISTLKSIVLFISSAAFFKFF